MDLATLTPLKDADDLLSRPSVRYDDDLHAWALEQAASLRSGAWSRLDIEHLADEIEDVGGSEVRELRSAIALVLQHLLKWDGRPERRSRSWVLSLRVHRRRALRALKKNPSLKSILNDLTAEAYEDGRDAALQETGLPEASFPAACPYGWDEIMTRPIEWPEQP